MIGVLLFPHSFPSTFSEQVVKFFFFLKLINLSLWRAYSSPGNSEPLEKIKTAANLMLISPITCFFFSFFFYPFLFPLCCVIIVMTRHCTFGCSAHVLPVTELLARIRTHFSGCGLQGCPREGGTPDGKFCDRAGNPTQSCHRNILSRIWDLVITNSSQTSHL